MLGGQQVTSKDAAREDEDDEDVNDESKDGADLETAYNVVIMRETFARLEDMMETHNSTIEKILGKLAVQKPIQDHKKNRQPFSVKVVRDSKGFISELLIEPK
jgi:hypothetical protein